VFKTEEWKYPCKEKCNFKLMILGSLRKERGNFIRIRKRMIGVSIRRVLPR
jgi:hypothetical protein